MNFPKLHIFLGAGGVGKTTLSAAFALSLANSGKNVGLISIDPAKRLQSALGVENIYEVGVIISLPQNNSGGQLRAAVLHVNESLARWVEEKGMSPEKQEKLYANPYFSALADKMASSTETFAAMRVAEWLEQYPDTEDLVIDTAPGIHAIDFIAKPEKISAFLDSKMVDWLKWFSMGSKEKQNIFTRVLKSGARKLLDGLALVGGRSFLVNLGEFLILIDDVLLTALARLQIAQKWLKHPSTNIILVASVRDDAAYVAKELGLILKKMDMAPRLSILNRSFPASLKKEMQTNQVFQKWLSIEGANTARNVEGAFPLSGNSQNLFCNYLLSYDMTEQNVFAQLSSFSKAVVEIPVSVGLDAGEELRLIDLCVLGDVLRKYVKSSL